MIIGRDYTQFVSINKRFEVKLVKINKTKTKITMILHVTSGEV